MENETRLHGTSPAAMAADSPGRMPAAAAAGRVSPAVTRDLMAHINDFLSWHDFPRTVAMLAEERSEKRAHVDSSLGKLPAGGMRRARLRTDMVRVGAAAREGAEERPWAAHVRHPGWVRRWVGGAITAAARVPCYVAWHWMHAKRSGCVHGQHAWLCRWLDGRARGLAGGYEGGWMGEPVVWRVVM
eukprot:353141-Chlamydomonas_euryale.AAC.2